MKYLMTGKKVFLIDGIGAIVSTCCLVTLMYLENIFGMPKSYLYLFITVGFISSIYSISCYYLNPINWRKYLRIIAISNVAYCTLTLICIYINASKLTTLGIIYFVAEIIIIIALALLELKIARR